MTAATESQINSEVKRQSIPNSTVSMLSESLVGALTSDIDDKRARAERLNKYQDSRDNEER
jgi:hypothetical protein